MGNADRNDLAVRTKQFALDIIRLFAALPAREECRIIGRQLLRSGTSVGAYYREASAARSKAEFIAKLGDCAKEINETQYWLELLDESGLATSPALAVLSDEARELTAIFVTSLKTAKSTPDRGS